MVRAEVADILFRRLAAFSKRMPVVELQGISAFASFLSEVIDELALALGTSMGRSSDYDRNVARSVFVSGSREGNRNVFSLHFGRPKYWSVFLGFGSRFFGNDSPKRVFQSIVDRPLRVTLKVFEFPKKRHEF